MQKRIFLLAFVALLFFSGLASSCQCADPKSLQSQTYWRGEARPFGVLEVIQLPNGTLSLVLQNVESEKTLLKSITVSGDSGNQVYNLIDSDFGGGERKTLNILADMCKGKERKEYNLTFTYDSPYEKNLAEKGAKAMIVACPGYNYNTCGCGTWLDYFIFLPCIFPILIAVGLILIVFYKNHHDEKNLPYKIGLPIAIAIAFGLALIILIALLGFFPG